MLSGDLRAVLRLKHMAGAAAGPDRIQNPSEAEEAIAAYRRLRDQAREVNERAGWSVDDFDREIPAGDFDYPRPAGRIGGRPGADEAYDLVSVVGPRARVLLLQLAAWAAGHAETFGGAARRPARQEEAADGLSPLPSKSRPPLLSRGLRTTALAD